MASVAITAITTSFEIVTARATGISLSVGVPDTIGTGKAWRRRGYNRRPCLSRQYQCWP